MKFFAYGKDGGQESTVSGFWLTEIKALFSVVLLKFGNGSRDAFHSHAFNCISWVLRGKLTEYHLDGRVEVHGPSLWPVITRRDTFHKVVSDGNTWVFSLRGPWSKTWAEYAPATNIHTTLTHGREVID